MGNVADIVRVAVIWLVVFVVQNIMIRLVQPGSSLYETGVEATNLNGAALANQWFQIIVIWIPLIIYGGTLLWITVRLYKRQAATAIARP